MSVESSSHFDERPTPVREWIRENEGRRPRFSTGVSPQMYGLSLVLFLATLLTTTFVGVWFYAPRNEDDLLKLLAPALQYSASVMLILLCHELGHFLQARRYGIPALPPLFLPLPAPPFGTLGAVIIQHAGIGNRKEMFDVAISGPLAGLAVTLPLLYLGLQRAEFMPIPESGAEWTFGDPLLLQWMAELVLGPKPAGHDISLNPLLHAAWVGVFITALNLFPVGQLDGGHILYTLIGRRAHVVAQAVVAGGFVWMVWTGNYAYALMLVLISLLGIRHRPTADDSVALGTPRIVLGWLTLGFLVIGFTPTAIQYNSAADVVQPDMEPNRTQPPPPRRMLDPDEIAI